MLTTRTAPRQGADSTAYLDPVSGITFASYTNDHNIIFRIAVPDTTWNKTYDSIVQILSPVSMGWAGLAWGGSMTYNPLTIAWANGTSNAVVSSREALCVALNLPSLHLCRHQAGRLC